MNFVEIVLGIQQTKSAFKQSAIAAVNNHLTIRNWLIGLYIVEFEQKGEDRAKYGERLLQTLAENLSDNSLSYSNLKVYRQFYLSYIQFAELVPLFLKSHFDSKGQSLIGGLDIFEIKESTLKEGGLIKPL
jgi:hypothetical protein